MHKDGFTIVELVVVVVIIGILVMIILPDLLHRLPQPRNPACVNNLKQLGLVLNLYGLENNERFPPIDDTKNNFIFDGNFLYPEYLTDFTIMVCPQDPEYDPNANMQHLAIEAHPDCITDGSYIYLGWMVMSDDEAEAFFEAYDTLNPNDYEKDIVVPEGKGNRGGTTLHRLGRVVNRYLYTMIDGYIVGKGSASLVPIMWERPSKDLENSNHRDYGSPGGHVLYLDGHVEFIEFGKEFPMTETMARLLDERPCDPIPDCEE